MATCSTCRTGTAAERFSRSAPCASREVGSGSRVAGAVAAFHGLHRDVSGSAPSDPTLTGRNSNEQNQVSRVFEFDRGSAWQHQNSLHQRFRPPSWRICARIRNVYRVGLPGADDWSLGVGANYLDALLRTWAQDYDWRDVEARIRPLLATTAEKAKSSTTRCSVPSNWNATCSPSTGRT